MPRPCGGFITFYYLGRLEKPTINTIKDVTLIKITTLEINISIFSTILTTFSPIRLTEVVNMVLFNHT